MEAIARLRERATVPPKRADHARNSLERLAARPADGHRPSLFVRVLARDGQQSLLLPMGMSWLADAGDAGAFLGRRVRIEMPLPRQRYDRPDACVADWRLVLPPRGIADEALKTARWGVQDLLESWGEPAFTRMTDLDAWLRGKPDGGARPASALVVVGHQDYNRFSYGKKDSAYSTAVQSRWQNPSFVILNGCNTGAVGATDFVRRLGLDGEVAAVVATSFGVDPAMAADFLVCFDDSLATREREPLGVIFAATLDCLYARTPWKLEADNERVDSLDLDRWGALSLGYILVGNSGIRVCRPRQG